MSIEKYFMASPSGENQNNEPADREKKADKGKKEAGPVAESEAADQSVDSSLEDTDTSNVDSDESGDTYSTPKKKRKIRLNTFQAKWESEFGCIAAVIGNAFKAFCKTCRREFNISHGGKSTITYHIMSEEHNNATRQTVLDLIESSKRATNGMSIMVNTSKNMSAADNTISNFGCRNSLSTKTNEDLVKANCKSHIVDICARKACTEMNLDIENLVNKIFGHFLISDERNESLKSFFEFFDTEFEKVLGSCIARWIAIGPATNNITKNWEPLKSYFLSVEREEWNIHLAEMLNIDFENGTLDFNNSVLTTLLFVNHAISVFEKHVNLLQRDDLVSIDVYDIWQSLLDKLDARLKYQFYGTETTKSLSLCDNSTKIDLMKQFDASYTTAIEYLKNNFDFSENNWLFLVSKLNFNNSVPIYKDFINVIRKLDLTKLELDEDALFDEIRPMRDQYTRLLETKVINACTKSATKWESIYKNGFHNEIPNIFKIVQFLMSIPLERV